MKCVCAHICNARECVYMIERRERRVKKTHSKEELGVGQSVGCGGVDGTGKVIQEERIFP